MQQQKYLLSIYIYICSPKKRVFKPLRSRILLDFFAMSSSSLTRLAVSAMAGVTVGFGLGAWYALRLGRRKVGEERNKQTSVLFPDLCMCVVLLFCYFAICFLFCGFVLSNMLTNYSHWALSVPELAKKVHASRANLEFFFSEFTGFGPVIFLRQLLMNVFQSIMLKRYGHMRNMLYSAISVVWRWNLVRLSIERFWRTRSVKLTNPFV